MKNSIQFINHASILVSNSNKSILTDPWYSGSSFDDGWKLLYENSPDEIKNILKNVDFIWYSHEHPDHFSIKFLIEYENILKDRKIKFIFQKTKDKRVVSFLKSKGFEYIELNDNEIYWIDHKFSLKIQRSDFYDSALILNLDGKKIFNLNDCPIKTEKELKDFKKKYGDCDFLFTQFSYAAWKGGEKNLNWRVNAAKEKIKTLKNQSNILNSKFTIPFASFIKFCDKYNFYLNDSINSPDKIINNTKNLKSKILFLKPYEFIDLDNPLIETQGFKFWMNIYKDEKNFQILENKNIYDFKILEENFTFYKEKIYKKNSKSLIKIMSKLKFFNFFQPLVIKLRDLEINIKVDLANELFEITNLDPDIEMYSRSLYLIFKQDFGFDTLTVNGCFEEKKANAFVKMSKSFAIGNLNNLGIKLNYLIIFNFFVINLFLKKLVFIKKKLV